MLLPRPRARLENQGGDVEELRELEKRCAPNWRIISQWLREVPSRTSHDQEMVVTHVPIPQIGCVGRQKLIQFESVFEAGIDFRAVEEFKGVDAGVIREEDGVGERWIGGETRVFEDPTVENEFEHGRIGAIPTVRGVVGFLTQAMIG